MGAEITRCTTLVPTPKVRPIFRMPIPSAFSSRMRASTDGFTVRRPSFVPFALARCACRKLNPAILVMQSAQDWATKNVPGAIDAADETVDSAGAVGRNGLPI
jgi:hypothetical protein